MLCLTTLDESSPGLALGTEQGVVKRVVPDYPANKDDLEVIGLKEGDVIVGAVELRTGEEDLVFITDDAQLLRYPASPGAAAGPSGRRHGGHQAHRGREGDLLHRGRPGGGRGGVHGGPRPRARSTAAEGTAKLTPFDQYPRKGRATGGVRCQRFLRGESGLVLAWAGAGSGPRGHGQRLARGAARPRTPAATAPASPSPNPSQRSRAHLARPFSRGAPSASGAALSAQARGAGNCAISHEWRAWPPGRTGSSHHRPR